MRAAFGRSTASFGRPWCLAALALPLALAGCAGISADALNLLRTPLFPTLSGGDNTGTADPVADTSGDSFFGNAGRESLDPCEESNARKFITISMRNRAVDHIHYFLALIADVDTDARPGAVCVDDIGLYTDFGYQFIQEGSSREFGDYCIRGPALFLYHGNGNFRAGGGRGGATGAGVDTFASAIPPAQGNSPTFDAFFTAAGARVPVPDRILFHNPGTGEGAALQIARLNASPCQMNAALISSPRCDLDAFYYVDEFDLISGSTALGPGSGRRVPNEIQDTGCRLGFQEAFHSLAPSGATAATANDNEFLRGGRIDYVFFREDTTPAFPQLLWEVTDMGGGLVHELDPRAPL